MSRGCLCMYSTEDIARSVGKPETLWNHLWKEIGKKQTALANARLPCTSVQLCFKQTTDAIIQYTGMYCNRYTCTCAFFSTRSLPFSLCAFWISYGIRNALYHHVNLFYKFEPLGTLGFVGVCECNLISHWRRQVVRFHSMLVIMIHELRNDRVLSGIIPNHRWSHGKKEISLLFTQKKRDYQSCMLKTNLKISLEKVTSAAQTCFAAAEVFRGYTTPPHPGLSSWFCISHIYSSSLALFLFLLLLFLVDSINRKSYPDYAVVRDLLFLFPLGLASDLLAASSTFNLKCNPTYCIQLLFLYLTVYTD